ncbi:MAG: Hsp20/alpha crystallin family protein [Candidatus Sumerlaeia bacterium]|nr:Hsp20/alpha crystallin family protein [Candidatus Sumerlaeia bacterium]
MAELTVSNPNELEARANAPATRDESEFLVPPTDIYETKEALVVVADLPGVEQSGLSLHVEDGVLTIDATPSSTLAEAPAFREFRLARFHRQFRLTDEVDQDRIAADLKHGVLRITLPKAAKAQPRAIPVRVEA